MSLNLLKPSTSPHSTRRPAVPAALPLPDLDLVRRSCINALTERYAAFDTLSFLFSGLVAYILDFRYDIMNLHS